MNVHHSMPATRPHSLMRESAGVPGIVMDDNSQRNRRIHMRGKSIITALAVVVVGSTVAIQARERADRALYAGAAPGIEPRFSRVRLSTGVELHVVESGPADGRPVLFL